MNCPYMQIKIVAEGLIYGLKELIWLQIRYNTQIYLI